MLDGFISTHLVHRIKMCHRAILASSVVACIFIETAPDIWIVQETEVAAVALFLLHSLQSLFCKFKPLACTFYQAAVPVAARGSLIFAVAKRSLAWSQRLVYTTESLYGRRGKLSFPRVRGAFPSYKHGEGLVGWPWL